MRRLFGTIGLTYLTVLTVAFYLYEPAVLWTLVGLAAVGTGIGAVLTLRNRLYGRSILAAGISIAAAVLSIFLYQNIVYQPTIEKYSDKEITFKGYLYDEVFLESNKLILPLQTEEINGEPASVKIEITVYGTADVLDFDCVEGRLTPETATYSRMLSDKCFFTAEQDARFELHRTGETHATPYQWAVAARKAVRKVFDRMLSRSSASMCRAIALGDQSTMSKSARHDFRRTGTSFLIVVSGMHLSVLTGLLYFFISKLKLPRLILCLLMIAIIVSFAAVTGFTHSVMRAGIMLSIAHCRGVIHRKNDSVNSLGIAALVLSIGNPFIVGDLGVLMSFSTTLGIVLWADKIHLWIDNTLRISRIRIRFIRRCLSWWTNLISVSVSAALWVTPIAMLFTERISTMVIPVSVITSPIASLILILSLPLTILYYVPFTLFLAKLVALGIHVLCSLLFSINSVFASLPFATVTTDKSYWYVWMAVTAALVLVGYLLSEKKRYIPLAVGISALTLLTGWSIATLTDSHPTEVYLSQSTRGLSIAVGKDDNLSLLACGGTGTYQERLLDKAYSYSDTADFVIIPNQQNYAAYDKMLREHLTISNLLLNGRSDETADCYRLEKNETLTLRLNADTLDRVMNISGITFQYLTIGDRSLLFVPHYGDISKLPEEYRTADVVVMDYVSYHAELLDCQRLIYTGQLNKRYRKYADLLREIADEVEILNRNQLSIYFE